MPRIFSSTSYSSRLWMILNKHWFYSCRHSLYRERVPHILVNFVCGRNATEVGETNPLKTGNGRWKTDVTVFCLRKWAWISPDISMQPKVNRGPRWCRDLETSVGDDKIVHAVFSCSSNVFVASSLLLIIFTAIFREVLHQNTTKIIIGVQSKEAECVANSMQARHNVRHAKQ